MDFRLVPEPSSPFAQVPSAAWEVDWLFDGDRHAWCIAIGHSCVRSQMLIVPVSEDGEL